MSSLTITFRPGKIYQFGFLKDGVPHLAFTLNDAVMGSGIRTEQLDGISIHVEILNKAIRC